MSRKIGCLTPMKHVANGLPRDLEKHLRKVETFVSDSLVPLENVARHISRADTELENVRILQASLAYLVQNQIEQLKARGRGHKAISPSAYKGSVMEFVFGTDEASHSFVLSEMPVKSRTPIADQCRL